MRDNGERIDPTSFAAAFKQFVDNVNFIAAKETTPLIERLREYLGPEPGQVPIVAEEFESYEHPNVQMALDAVTKGEARQVELIGVAAANKRWGAITFSDLLSGTGPYGRISQGSVDWINFRLESGSELAKRIVGFGSAGVPIPGPIGPMRPAGFPTATVEVKRPS